MSLKLYLISQTVNNDYDTYDSAVVAAENVEGARYTGPSTYYPHWTDKGWAGFKVDGSRMYEGKYNTWAEPADVQVKYLGEAVEGTKPGVICASFNAG